ncbi:hypothetical protein [Kitasatospora purpeofusca]|uniref:hypothetical protein n=1 Tax=Kitasatospora purpeofusca TaxID=67352 RepID=UPI00364AFD2A
MQRRTLSILFSVLVALAAVFIAPSAAQATQGTSLASAAPTRSTAVPAAVPASVLARAWYGWENLGGSLAPAPALSSWGSGRLDLFALSGNHSVRHRWYNGNGWSSSWEDLGGSMTSGPAAVSWGPDRIDVVANSSGALWHAWWT